MACGKQNRQPEVGAMPRLCATAELDDAADQTRPTYVGKRAAKGSSGNRKALVI